MSLIATIGSEFVAFARFASSFYWGWGKEKLPAELTLVSLQFETLFNIFVDAKWKTYIILHLTTLPLCYGHMYPSSPQ